VRRAVTLGQYDMVGEVTDDSATAERSHLDRSSTQFRSRARIRINGWCRAVRKCASPARETRYTVVSVEFGLRLLLADGSRGSRYLRASWSCSRACRNWYIDPVVRRTLRTRASSKKRITNQARGHVREPLTTGIGSLRWHGPPARDSQRCVVSAASFSQQTCRGASRNVVAAARRRCGLARPRRVAPGRSGAQDRRGQLVRQLP